jgi:hypothetical protein
MNNARYHVEFNLVDKNVNLEMSDAIRAIIKMLMTNITHHQLTSGNLQYNFDISDIKVTAL